MEKDFFEKRVNHISVAVFFLAIVLVSRLGYVQLVKGNYYLVRAESNSSRKMVIDAPRGDIESSDGVTLVSSRPAYVVSYLVPPEEAQREQAIPILATILAEYGVSEESIRQAIVDNVWRRYQPIRLAVDVSDETVFQIDERRMDLPGVVVERQAVRDYRYGNLACYLIGGLGAITPNKQEEYEAAGYRSDATVGIFGLENAFENVDPALSLRGQDGYRLVEVDNYQRLVAAVSETPPVAGNKMVLTIDSELQIAAEQAILDIVEKLNDKDARYKQKPNKAAAVVLNVKTGEILAWASYPEFDPGNWAKSSNLWTSNIPLNAYPVGSTFKPLMSLLALTEGIVTPTEKFYCPGYYQVGNTKKYCANRSGHGHLTLEEGIKVSCNVVYYDIAQRLVSKYGRAEAMDKIGDMVKLLQFGSEIPLDFATGYLRAPGIIPTSENFRRVYNYTPYPGEVWDVAIGQGIVEFTPLQMAAYTSLLANGGYHYQPHVVQKIVDPSGNVSFQVEPKLLAEVDLDPAALGIVRNGMHEVTLPARPGGPGNGSAYYLFTYDPVMRDGQKVEVAAKTGSAEVGPGISPHSWFIGYAPFDDPEIAVAVFVGHGRWGATAGVPVGHAIMKAYFEGLPEVETVSP
ncbi:MAG TPA: hypothetical protein DDZ53_02485 [Firmicutes bacterium]|jgi:penicillin-binding protein 2|nr:hypothetical protein [Bacillota bacterium]